jgi:hypothetical protein
MQWRFGRELVCGAWLPGRVCRRVERVLLRDLLQGHEVVQSSVIHQNIQPAEAFLCGRKELLYFGCLGDVCLEDECVSTLGLDSS